MDRKEKRIIWFVMIIFITCLWLAFSPDSTAKSLRNNPKHFSQKDLDKSYNAGFIAAAEDMYRVDSGIAQKNFEK